MPKDSATLKPEAIEKWELLTVLIICVEKRFFKNHRRTMGSVIVQYLTVPFIDDNLQPQSHLSFTL